MKTNVIAPLFLCTLLTIAGCKKEAAPSKEEATAPPLTRTLGLLPTSGDQYSRMIKESRLANLKAAAVCSSVDLTNLFPPPGDQGLQGSCVSWAVAYSAKSFKERQEVGWSITTANHQFSPQYVYSLTHFDNSRGGGGSFFSDALNLLNNSGVPPRDISPYNPSDPYGYSVQPTDLIHREAFTYRNTSWSGLPYRDVEEIRSHLCNNEPVVLGIPIYPDFDNLSYSNDTYDNLLGAYRGLHAITLIGYDDARQAFKFVNQWGIFWGLGGYGWISYNLIANNDFESYVMYDAPNPLYTETYNASSSAGMGTMGYYSGDFNGDGNTDIIHPWNNYGTLAIIAHNISGTGTSFLTNQTLNGIGSGSVGIIPADFDGDGKTDLVQGWSNGGTLMLTAFKSNGSTYANSWTGSMSQGSGNLGLLPVDFDGDGKTDIAHVWNNSGKLAVFIYRSTGTSYYQAYSYVQSTLGSGNVGLFPADYDGDGKTDIIQCWNHNGKLNVTVLRSTGTSYYNSWNGAMSQGSPNVGIAPVDYNADGKVDFVQGWNNNGKLNLLVYQSTGIGYSYIGNVETREGYNTYGLLPVKRVGVPKTGVVQVWKDGSNTAFFRYDVKSYQ